MAIEQLKDLMGKPDVIILDVRAKSDWDKAQTKILGAIREDPNKPTKSWAEKYGKDKTIVLYCA
jgi:rhodanese-related sulfurtransferase